MPFRGCGSAERAVVNSASSFPKPADARPLFQRMEQEYPDHKLTVDAMFRLAEDDYANKNLATHGIPRTLGGGA